MRPARLRSVCCWRCTAILAGVDNAKDLYQAAKSVKDWLWRDSRVEAQRERDGLPSKKETRDLVWDLRDTATLATVVGYKARILLENGCGRKTRFEAPMRDEPIEILFGGDRINFRAGGQDSSFDYTGSEWDPAASVGLLVERDLQGFETAGWTVETGAEKVVLKQTTRYVPPGNLLDRNRLMVVNLVKDKQIGRGRKPTRKSCPPNSGPSGCNSGPGS